MPRGQPSRVDAFSKQCHFISNWPAKLIRLTKLILCRSYELRSAILFLIDQHHVDLRHVDLRGIDLQRVAKNV